MNTSASSAAKPAGLDLPTPEGWKAELTLGLVIYQDGSLVRRQSVTHPTLDTEPSGIELTIFCRFDFKSNLLIATPLSHRCRKSEYGLTSRSAH